MVKIALVGCGGIGMAHLRAYKELKDVIVSAVVDRDMKKAEAAAEFSGAQALNDISQIASDIDGVSVVTPPQSHFQITSDLLERNFNVFCEKPLTMNTEEAGRLIEIAERKKKALMVGFKMRFEPIFQEAKKLLPKIGKLLSVSSVKQQPFRARATENWIPKVGAMYELSVHDFDLINWIAEIEPEEVLFSKLDYRLGWERENAFFLTVKYSKDVTGQLQGMYALENEFMYRDLTLTFTGEKGYMRVERPDRIVLHTSDYSVKEINPAGVNAFVSELQHFCDVIRGEKKNMLDGKFGLMTTKIVEDANKIKI
ncbi:MAG: hypothetical protein A2017_18040 [Lentisphaerae bacterium GWF2_44_16]|nr:MAG: hypothetical protein A2017_18040 [Lentisphaerae bacterium GWF2_44_16]